MATRFDTISFLSDYGLTDEYVAVVKSVLRTMAPGVTVIDITHDIAPHDIRAGALALARAAQYLHQGVVLGAVDPAAGGDRRHVAIEVGDGASILVGPDNGLFAPAVALVGGATAVVELDNTEMHLPAAGPTLDAARDIYAPVAAQLCLGATLTDVGTPIEAGGLQPGVLPIAMFEDGRHEVSILWVDRFGNAQLNVGPDDLDQHGSHFMLRWDGGERPAQRVASFADVGPGVVGLIVDSYGVLALALDRGSVAAELGIEAGTAVTLEPLASPAPPTVTSPVELRSKPSS
ncbi:MAG: hypothetical protein HKN26_10945 [Acidimicrobiales bacterium]|nr:hypothetical protein [Acidimicrobiales bacterium]